MNTQIPEDLNTSTTSKSNVEANNKSAIASEKPIFLNARSVRELVGLSESTIRRLRKSGQFPTPFRLTPGAAGHLRWEEREVLEWLRTRIEAS